eukprot:8139408-Ditylum_brightwellii.AAC.1
MVKGRSVNTATLEGLFCLHPYVELFGILLSIRKRGNEREDSDSIGSKDTKQAFCIRTLIQIKKDRDPAPATPYAW